MNQLDQYFKNRLEAHEVQPSAQIWDKIAQSGAIGPQKATIVPLYRRVAVAATISAGVIIAAAIWMRPNGAPEGTFALETPIELSTDTKEKGMNNSGDQPVNIPQISNTPNGDAKSESESADPKVKEETSKPASHSPAKSKSGGRKTPSAEERLEYKEKRSILAYQPVEMLDSYIQYVPSSQFEITYFSVSQALALAANPPVIQYDNGPVDWEAIMYANQIPKEVEEETITGKLFQLASEKINTFADASGLSLRKLSRISEIEIIY
jgi:hypothetical protein